jgi:rod shape-determining protein MreD
MTAAAIGHALAATVKAAAILLCAVLLQVTVATDVRVLGGTPDLVVVAVVSIALLRGPVAGACAGFAGGFLIDALGLGLIGTTSLTLVAVGYAWGAWGERVADTAPVRPLIAVAGASFVSSAGALLVATLIGSGPPISTLVFAIVPGAMLSVLCAIVVYPLIRRVLRRPAAADAAAPARVVPA